MAECAGIGQEEKCGLLNNALMEHVFILIGNIIEGLCNILKGDVHSFKCNFPQTWFLWFTLLRIIPYLYASVAISFFIDELLSRASSRYSKKRTLRTVAMYAWKTQFLPLGWFKHFGKANLPVLGMLIYNSVKRVIVFFKKSVQRFVFLFRRNLRGVMFDTVKSESLFDLVLLTLVGAAFRLYFTYTIPYITFYNDGICRLQQTRMWRLGDSFLPSTVWLPFHYTLISLLCPFGVDEALSGRIVTVTLGILTIPLFYSMCCKAFNRPIAFWATLLLALNGFHIRLTSMFQTLVPFVFFLILALWSIHLYFKMNKKRWLILAILAVNAFTMLRFEGWGLMFLFSLYFGYRILDGEKFFSFTILSGASIVFFSVALLFNETNPFIGITASDAEVEGSFSYYTGHELEFIKDRLTMLPPLPVSIFILWGAGVLLAIYYRFKPFYFLLFFPLLILVIFKVATLSLLPQWRYFVPYLLLLLPFAVIPLVALVRINAFFKALCVGAIVMVNLSSVERHYTNLVENTQLVDGLDDACRQMKVRFKNPDHVLIELKGGNYCPWQEKIGMAENNYYRPFFPEEKKYITEYEKFDRDVASRVLKDSAYRFIFWQKGLGNDSVLDSAIRNVYYHENTGFIYGSSDQMQWTLDTLTNSDNFFVAEIKRFEK